jgi:hypothetical protein
MRDRLNGIEVTGRCCSETGLNHINPHFLQLSGNSDFLFPGH